MSELTFETVFSNLADDRYKQADAFAKKCDRLIAQFKQVMEGFSRTGVAYWHATVEDDVYQACGHSLGEYVREQILAMGRPTVTATDYPTEHRLKMVGGWGRATKYQTIELKIPKQNRLKGLVAPLLLVAKECPSWPMVFDTPDAVLRIEGDGWRFFFTGEEGASRFHEWRNTIPTNKLFRVMLNMPAE